MVVLRMRGYDGLDLGSGVGCRNMDGSVMSTWRKGLEWVPAGL